MNPGLQRALVGAEYCHCVKLKITIAMLFVRVICARHDRKGKRT